jgi:antagonist of KipI
MDLLVTSAAYQTTVQDCGRFGFRKFGVASGGALDPVSLQLANLLVGNPECAAGWELTSGRFHFRCSEERLIAWSGGEFTVSIAGTAIPRLHSGRLPADTTCEILGKHGRAWIAISGGINVGEVLGSRATDLRARFGGFHGRALRDGDELPLGRPGRTAKRIGSQISGLLSDWSAPRLDSGEYTLRIIPGEHWNHEAGQTLLGNVLHVGMNSDRMGLRLETWRRTGFGAGELVSEPVTPGTIQLPPNGQPIVLLADCQTVGGYPRIAHVITVDLARAAQLQALDEVRFERTTLKNAQDLLRQRAGNLALFCAGLEARFG